MRKSTDWKEKATKRSAEIKKQNKRLREISASRDDWKAKAMAQKKRADNLEKDLKKIKERLSEII